MGVVGLAGAGRGQQYDGFSVDHWGVVRVGADAAGEFVGGGRVDARGRGEMCQAGQGARGVVFSPQRAVKGGNLVLWSPG